MTVILSNPGVGILSDRVVKRRSEGWGECGGAATRRWAGRARGLWVVMAIGDGM